MTIRQYLTAVVAEQLTEFGELDSRFQCNEDLVLRVGVEMTPVARIPDDVPLGPRGQCFANAGTLAVAPGCRYTYCEGYAMPLVDRSPVLHAWLVTPDGRVVDPTWGVDPAYRYLGVPFRRDFLVASILRTRLWGLLDDGQREPLIDTDPVDYLADRYLRRMLPARLG